MATHQTSCPICKKMCRGVYQHIQVEHPERLVVNLPTGNSDSEKDSEIASLKEQVSKAPSSIADFSGEEQAAYFTEFLKRLTDDEKAKLAEETGFGKPPIPPAPAPAAEVPAPLAEGDKGDKSARSDEGDKPQARRIILTLHGKPIN